MNIIDNNLKTETKEGYAETIKLMIDMSTIIPDKEYGIEIVYLFDKSPLISRVYKKFKIAHKIIDTFSKLNDIVEMMNDNIEGDVPKYYAQLVITRSKKYQGSSDNDENNYSVMISLQRHGSETSDSDLDITVVFDDDINGHELLKVLEALNNNVPDFV